MVHIETNQQMVRSGLCTWFKVDQQVTVCYGTASHKAEILSGGPYVYRYRITGRTTPFKTLPRGYEGYASVLDIKAR